MIGKTTDLERFMLERWTGRGGWCGWCVTVVVMV